MSLAQLLDERIRLCDKLNDAEGGEHTLPLSPAAALPAAPARCRCTGLLRAGRNAFAAAACAAAKNSRSALRGRASTDAPPDPTDEIMSEASRLLLSASLDPKRTPPHALLVRSSARSPPTAV